MRTGKYYSKLIWSNSKLILFCVGLMILSYCYPSKQQV